MLLSSCIAFDKYGMILGALIYLSSFPFSPVEKMAHGKISSNSSATYPNSTGFLLPYFHLKDLCLIEFIVSRAVTFESFISSLSFSSDGHVVIP